MKLTNTILSALAAGSALGMKLRHAESSYVSVSGTQFTIDGETGYFAGTNCYWCSFLTQHADVDSTLDHIAASGLRVLRVWGFNDVTSRPSAGTVWFQLLSSSGSTINTGADGLQTLDYLVQAAEARGIKLIIPLVNNWGDYGGMAAYVAAFGGSQTGWYTNAAAQQQYRAFVAAVVGRYSRSTAIFAWELANEPRCSGCDTGVVYEWAAGVSAYIKQLDANHLVTLGTEGFGLDAGDGSYPYTYYEGTDFAGYLNISTLDFGTFHLYPNSWGTSYDWGNGWIQTHGQACEAAGKPCMLEEYGAPYDHCSIEAPWQSTSLSSAGMAADLFWQWGDTLSTGQSQSDDNSVFYQTSDWQCLVQNHVAAVAAA